MPAASPAASMERRRSGPGSSCRSWLESLRDRPGRLRRKICRRFSKRSITTTFSPVGRDLRAGRGSAGCPRPRAVAVRAVPHSYFSPPPVSNTWMRLLSMSVTYSSPSRWSIALGEDEQAGVGAEVPPAREPKRTLGVELLDPVVVRVDRRTGCPSSSKQTSTGPLNWPSHRWPCSAEAEQSCFTLPGRRPGLSSFLVSATAMRSADDVETARIVELSGPARRNEPKRRCGVALRGRTRSIWWLAGVGDEQLVRPGSRRRQGRSSRPAPLARCTETPEHLAIGVVVGQARRQRLEHVHRSVRRRWRRTLGSSRSRIWANWVPNGCGVRHLLARFGFLRGARRGAG